MKTMNKNNVMMPKKTFAKFVDAMAVFNEVQEQIEDHLILTNKKIVSDLQRARLDHKKGRMINWNSLKAEYGL